MKRHGRFLLLSLTALLAVSAAHAADVTIYRCTDSKGHLTLRDTPCRKGEQQEARNMVRPTDPPPRPAPPPAPAIATPRESAPRYVMMTPPQPLYECVTPDGERYTSDTGEGHARWEPLWTYGYPAYPIRSGGGGYSANIGVRSGNVSGNVRIGERFPSSPPVLVPAMPTGQWVRDVCQRLPQGEVCDRLRDERYELNRRWNIAQPSERAQIDRETRGIDARLANDCGGS
jgi:hypothetical protein